jgi:phycobilisome rod-core linker protein
VSPPLPVPQSTLTLQLKIDRLLEYPPRSQNQRVAGYEIPGDEQPRIYTTENLPSDSEIDELIKAAYRQIFNEQQLIVSNRQKALESQLKVGQITVRDFIRGLVLSDTFRRRNYEPNNNYRFVQMCVQRLLGRDVYHEREKLAWSIVLATKGLEGFADNLLNSGEYLANFGYDTVPYQRRRILPQRAQGELPFARMPRYGDDYRAQLEALGYFKHKPILTYRWEWQKPPYPAWLRKTGAAITIAGAIFLTIVVMAVALAAWGIIRL